MRVFPRATGASAALLFCASVLGFGAALDGYAQAIHPVALLGARGVAHAGWFDAVGFVLPGLLSALVALRLRGQLLANASWTARIGAGLVLVSALAFAAQGLLPLDIQDLDAPASQRHATAWSAWWIAFVAGTLLLAPGLHRRSSATPRAAWISVVAGLLVLGFAALATGVMPAAVAQRLAFVTWFAWMAVVPFVIDAAD